MESFDAFARRNHARLVGALRLYCGDLDMAEDAASDTMVKLLASWDRMASIENPEAWMYRVAFNLVKSRYRRRAAEGRALAKLRIESTMYQPDFVTAVVVRQAVAALPRRQAQAVVCRYFLGMAVNESAAVMGVTPGSLKVYTSRGLSRLRKELGADLVEEQFHG